MLCYVMLMSVSCLKSILLTAIVLCVMPSSLGKALTDNCDETKFKTSEIDVTKCFENFPLRSYLGLDISLFQSVSGHVVRMIR